MLRQSRLCFSAVHAPKLAYTLSGANGFVWSFANGCQYNKPTAKTQLSVLLLSGDTEVSATKPPDYKAACFLRLLNSSAALCQEDEGQPSDPRPGFKNNYVVNAIEIVNLLTDALVCWNRSYRGLSIILGQFVSFTQKCCHKRSNTPVFDLMLGRRQKG